MTSPLKALNSLRYSAVNYSYPTLEQCQQEVLSLNRYREREPRAYLQIAKAATVSLTLPDEDEVNTCEDDKQQQRCDESRPLS